MKPELKSKWLYALRSGKYDQGRRYLERKLLNDVTVHCCLGVLADLCELERSNSFYKSDITEFKTDQFNSFIATLPVSYLNEIGLSTGRQEILIRMNDGGQSFADIASWIEEHVPVEESNL